MFFNTNSISFEVLSVLSLGWDKRNDKSGSRTYHALSYRINGDAKFIHEDLRVSAKTGDIVYVPPDYEYTLKVNTLEENLIVVHFISDSDLPKKIKCFHTENHSYFERKFNELYIAWTKKQFGYEHECKSILYKIITKMEREHAESKIDGSHDKIIEAVEYIHDNFTDYSLSVDYLARMCNMSDTYFRRLFVKNLSITPIQYINNLKLNYAKELLKSGYYTVQEVSDKCGFNTINYFSEFIKRKTGLCPSDFMSNK